MAVERRKNGTIEMSAARMASMMDEGGEVGGDVPMVKVRSLNTPCHVMCHHAMCQAVYTAVLKACDAFASSRAVCLLHPPSVRMNTNV